LLRLAAFLWGFEMNLTLFEKIMISVWIAVFLGGITTMIVLGVSSEPFDLKAAIEEQVTEAQGD